MNLSVDAIYLKLSKGLARVRDNLAIGNAEAPTTLAVIRGPDFIPGKTNPICDVYFALRTQHPAAQ